MSKLLILTVSCLMFFSVSGQESNLTKKKGIFIVENESELYFIETKKSRLIKLIQNSIDTVEAILVNAPGGGRDFFNYHRKITKFDSIAVRLEQTDLIEDSAKLYYVTGIIFYIRENGYPVSTRFKTLSFGSEKIVLRLQYFILLEKFSITKE